MTSFRMSKSIYGPYIQVRVRDASGAEDTVDRLRTADDVRSVYQRLSQEMTAMTTPDELESIIVRTFPH